MTTLPHITVLDLPIITQTLLDGAQCVTLSSDVIVTDKDHRGNNRIWTVVFVVRGEGLYEAYRMVRV